MDFDLGGMLSGLFSPASSGTPTTTMVGDYAMPTFGTDGKSPIMGWLGNNAGALSQAGAGLQQMNKPQQVQPLQINMARPPQPVTLPGLLTMGR
jgi:hypothetical protein